MSEFRATVLLIQTHIKIKEGDRELTKSLESCSTNQRHLEVIKLFDKGHCRVSSINATKLLGSDKKSFAFKVDFNTGDNLDVQEIIERFNDVFVFKSVSEVGKD